MSRIAFVMGSLNPGGDEIQMCELAARLKQAGHTVQLVLPNGAGTLIGNRLPWVRLHGLSVLSLVTARDKQPAIRRALASIRPDVMIGNGYPMTLWSAVAAAQAGVPVRVIKEGNCGFVRVEFPERETRQRDGYAAATHVVCNSQAVADSLEGVPGDPQAKAHVIYNGLDLPARSETLRQDARARLNVTDDDVVIGYLANFRRDGLKNQALLVEAARMVLEERPEALFMMAGYGSAYQEQVQALSKSYGLSERVRMPGRIEDKSLLAGWDIGTNCSRTEGFSNAIQQCMSYGLPMVATAVGGTVEQVVDGVNGYLVPSEDAGALAVRLLQLVEDRDLREQMGAEARQTAEGWAWAHILPEWARLCGIDLSAKAPDAARRRERALARRGKRQRKEV